MQKNKVIGGILVLLAVLFIISLFVEKTGLWFTLDYITIAVCAFSGFLLLKEK